MEAVIDQVLSTTPTDPATVLASVPQVRADGTPFVDRRAQSGTRGDGLERRQFTATASARPEVRELASAVDAYKLRHRRRFITYEELYDVVASLGYHK